jgi:hypothetical protein
MHYLFSVLSAAMSLVVMGADCTNAYANTPSLSQPTYVRIDDAYTDWYHSRYGKEVGLSLVLPVLKTLWRRPEAGALWEKHIIKKILDDLDLVYITRERRIYRGTIDGKDRSSMPTSRRHRCRLLRPYCGALGGKCLLPKNIC